MTTTRVERGLEQPRGSAAEPASQPGVLMVVIEIKPEGEALLNQWYDEEHIAESAQDRIGGAVVRATARHPRKRHAERLG